MIPEIHPSDAELARVILKGFVELHGCLPEDNENPTLQDLSLTGCEYVEDVNLDWLTQHISEIRKAALYVVQEESLFD